MRSSYSPFHLGLLPRRPPHCLCMLDEQLCSFQMKLTLQGVNEKSISVTWISCINRLFRTSKTLLAIFFYASAFKGGNFCQKKWIVRKRTPTDNARLLTHTVMMPGHWIFRTIIQMYMNWKISKHYQINIIYIFYLEYFIFLSLVHLCDFPIKSSFSH